SSSTTTTSTTTLPERPAVAAVGDSNLELVRDLLPTSVPDLDVYVEAVVGLTANDALPATDRAVAHEPDAVVVVLGTNDARDAPSAGDDLTAIRRVAVRLDAVPCVRWVTVNDSSPFPSMNAQARTINAELRRLAGGRHRFGIIPWADDLAAHPSWLMADGVHNSEEGRIELVRRLATAFRECLAGSASASVTNLHPGRFQGVDRPA
ncbi:MAG: GDSL-like Lipase/Acylhydrolase family, partial [Actinomycetota bacterium]|nr:GDSL-like Lipase/Acylhydrolase family [Actinomycetota bacterium]